MYELSNRDLDGIDIELGRYRTLASKIYLRRQELIHNKKHSTEDYTGGKARQYIVLPKQLLLELKKTKH